MPSNDDSQAIIDTTGSKPITNATVSTNIVTQLGNHKFGYIRTITDTQARPVTGLYETGTVGPVEVIPQQPALVTMAVTKVSVYGKNLINAITSALDTNDMTQWEVPRGMTTGDAQTALQAWFNNNSSNITSPQLIYSLQYLPLGFNIVQVETSPMAGFRQGSVLTTTFHGCWLTRTSRPVVSTGDLVIAETGDISARWVDSILT